MRPAFRLSLALAAAFFAALPCSGIAEDNPLDDDNFAVDEGTTMDTAIALNYCRASFHRIRKYPITPVLTQEKDKILNNLNLQGIQDAEVIELYTAVLDEINQIQVVQHERQFQNVHYRMSVRRQVAWDLLAFGSDLATGSVGSAIRQGADSWWDYRNLGYQRDTELWKVDKERIQSVTKKSSDFLSTFWKLARLKNIPDRWLVRGDDLDSLEVAYCEPDPKVRLRVLQRMEPYMQAYPPYWYYLARTQQEMGELETASHTYRELVEIGEGHFRKDDMLASSMANLAAIDENFGRSSAVVAARKALEYSTDVWEANLICARILERHGHVNDAEDAILRNLDVNLETTQSRVFLASLYFHADDTRKLAQFLAQPETVAALPAPVLLRCAARLGAEQTPQPVLNAILASLDVRPKMHFGPDDLVVRMAPAWQLHLARVDISVQGRPLQPVQGTIVAGRHQFRFANRFEFGTPLAAPNEGIDVGVRFTYPDQTVIHITMNSDDQNEESVATISQLPANTRNGTGSDNALQIAKIMVDETPISLTHLASRQ